MTNLQLVALVAMSAMKSRSEIDFQEFYGVHEYVETMVDKPIEGLRLVLKRGCGLDWDGKVPLWGFLVEALRQECLFERAHDLFGKGCEEIELAYTFVKHYEQMTNMDLPLDGPTLAKVNRCRQIVIGTVISKPGDVPRLGDEALSVKDEE